MIDLRFARAMPWLIALIGLNACAVASRPAAAPRTPPPTTGAASGTSQTTTSKGGPMIVGIGDPARWGATVLPYAQSLGVSAVRVDAPWKQVETQPQVYQIPNWLEQAVNTAIADKLPPILILDYGNPLYSSDKPGTPQQIEAFKKYAVFLVNHFKGRVHTYELWNEWNGKTGGTTPGDPQSYISFAQQIVPAIRAADSSAIILSQGVSPGGLRGDWLYKFFDLHGAQYFDGIAIHPYSWPWKNDRSPEKVMKLVEGYAEYGRRADGGKTPQFYITEMGYPSFQGDLGGSSETTAAYLSRFLLLASCHPYIRGVWWYSLIDDGTLPTEPEHHFGVYDFARTQKPAAVALKATVALLDQTNGQCTMTMNGDKVGLKLAKRDNHGQFDLSWTAVDVPPGNGAISAVANQTAGASQTGRLLFPLADADMHGVPRVTESGQ